jgi:WD40 repeat protein
LAGKELNNAITLWDWKTSQERMTLRGHSLWVWSLAVSPDGLTLASASGESSVAAKGEVMLWDMVSRRRKRTLEHGCVYVAFSPDGKTLASGAKGGGIALWQPDTGHLFKELVGHVKASGGLADRQKSLSDD